MSCPLCLQLSRIPTTNLQLRACLVAHVLLSDVAVLCGKWLLIAPQSLAVTPTHKKPVVTKHNTTVHSNRVWNTAGTMTACGHKTWEPHVSNPTMVASPARSLAPRHCRSTRDQTRVTHLWSLHLRPHAHAPSAAARATATAMVNGRIAADTASSLSVTSLIGSSLPRVGSNLQYRNILRQQPANLRSYYLALFSLRR